MRPPSIVLFERVYLISIALSIVSSVLFFLHPPAIAFPPGTPPAVAQMMRFLPVFSIAAALVIAFLFLYFIGRRGSDVARWIFIVFFALGLAGFVRQFGSHQPIVMPLALRAVGWLHLLLQAACVWLLLRPDAKSWFRT